MSKKRVLWWLVILTLLLGVGITPFWISEVYRIGRRALPAITHPIEQQITRKVSNEFLEPLSLGYTLIYYLEPRQGAARIPLSAYCTQSFTANFAHLKREWQSMKTSKGRFVSVEKAESISPQLLLQSEPTDLQSTRGVLFQVRLERGQVYLGIVVVRQQSKWYIQEAHLYTENPELIRSVPYSTPNSTE